jgi:ribonuclease P protein component
MLPDVNRLRKQKDIERVLALGSGCAGAGLRVKSIANTLKASRFCFIVSAAVAPRAVDRNLMKRRLRQAAQNLLGRIAASHDVVVWLQRLPADRSYAALSKALEINLVRSRLLTRDYRPL